MQEGWHAREQKGECLTTEIGGEFPLCCGFKLFDLFEQEGELLLSNQRLKCIQGCFDLLSLSSIKINKAIDPPKQELGAVLKQGLQHAAASQKKAQAQTQTEEGFGRA
jgi:hypothetical protein